MEEFVKFTHGIIVLNPKDIDEDDTMPIVHFTGYWEEPTIDDIEHLKEELRNDPDFDCCEIIDELEFLPADQELLDYFNDIVEDNNQLTTVILN
jgi:hypothetical protein